MLVSFAQEILCLYAVGSEWYLEVHVVYAQSHAKLNLERTVAHESLTQIAAWFYLSHARLNNDLQVD
jgi:hypothetical protein